MPAIGQLTRPVSRIEIPCEGDEPLVITYRRTAFSQKMLAELEQAGKASPLEQADLMARVLARLIVAWNLTDERKKVIPSTYEALADVDLDVLGLVFDAINGDMVPDPQQGETSDDGS